jgi:spermidine/putrescine transport system substrate-binding protein
MEENTPGGSLMTRRAMFRSALLGLLVLPALLLTLLPACDTPEQAAPKPARELVFFNYAEDTPDSVLQAFEKEFGIKIVYVTYDSPEESAARLRSGLACDVALIENQLVQPLVQEGLLAPVNMANVPNFRNISPNFRDLAFDPGNRHSIPADYGTTGLLVRTDLIGEGPKRWADLWNPGLAGKIGLRGQPREVIGMTLLSLGFSLNSENPEELAAAARRLRELRPAVTMVDLEASLAVPRLLSGEIAVLHGYSNDHQLAIESNPAVRFVLPAEGSALWGDSYVVLAGSRRQKEAETFINFLMRPEIAAVIVNEKGYASSNEAARQYVDPAIRDNPVVHPPLEELRQINIIGSLSPEGEKLYARIWDEFQQNATGRGE